MKKKAFTGLEDLKKVLFSDERVLCVTYGGQGFRVWRMKQDCIKWSVDFAVNVMVWDCMTANGTGKLCVVNKRIYSKIYQEILDHFMILSSEDLCGGDFIFQHDLAPSHRLVSTKNWISRHQINVLPWTDNSPDLNPIASLWGIMKKRLQDIAPKKN